MNLLKRANLVRSSTALLALSGAALCAQPALPVAPQPSLTQPSSQIIQVAGSVTGIITDSDGDAIPGARVTLTPSSQPPSGQSPSAPPLTGVSAEDGTFVLSSVPPGPFQFSVTAEGFSSQQFAGHLHPNEYLQLPTLTLKSAGIVDVQVLATQADIAEAQINLEEKQRVFGAIPNFYVSYSAEPVPLAPGQKFHLALRNLIDPVNLAITGATAGVEQASRTYNWGEGDRAYAKRFAASYGTFLTGTLLGNAVFPVLFHQDPRYFYKGAGTTRSRVLYALESSVICKGDNMHSQFNYSAILGSLAASGLSNLYYPSVDRTSAGLIFEQTALGTGIAAFENLMQEFVVRKLTPHKTPRP